MNKENWEVKKLGEVIDFINGFAFKSELFREDGLPIIRISNIQNDKINVKDVVYFDKIDYKTNLDKYKVRKNDILIAMSGATTGKIGIYFHENEIYLNQRVGAIRAKNNENYKYVFYFLKTKVEETLRRAIGVAQPNIGSEQIKEYNILIPPLSVQSSIVAELDSLHHLKELQEQQLSELDNLAQATFYDMFGDPIENEKGWEVKKLGDVCEINPSKAEIKELDKNTLVSFVPMANVGEKGELNLVETKSICEVFSGFTYFRNNDILFAKITPCMENGKGTIAHNLINNIGFGSTEFHILRPSKNIHSKYIFQILAMKDFRKIAEKKMTGSAGQKRVPKKFLESFEVSAPPFSLQTDFASRIEKIEAQKELIKQSIEQTEQLIGYTMDKYFN